MSPTMDHASSIPDMTSDQVHIAAKKRLEGFKFRRMETNNSASPLPSPLAHSHTRSHSRNSSTTSLSFSNSTNSTLSSISELSTSTSGSRPSSSANSRPGSHHRRRSSVSTRRESADLLGVTILELPASSSENNVNFGDKDSVRRRALLALEGKVDLSSGGTTVEIPQLDTPDVTLKSFEFPLKSPSSISTSFGLANPLLCRRDSFGKLLTPSSSMKDHLHTLIEEEEEDEQMGNDACGKHDVDVSPVEESCTPQKKEMTSPFTPELSITTPSPVAPRHRPASLVLRPLSLSPSLASNLPTPSLTPSPRPNGLRSLTLTSSVDNMPSLATPPSLGRRQSSMLVLSPSPSPVDTMPSRPPFLANASPIPASVSQEMQPKRQSSISYVRSISPATHLQASEYLPTPGATPTSERRHSQLSSIDDAESFVGRERPLSPDEQSFLYHSQPVLLGRISELERALRSRPGSRPTSMQSDISAASSEPSDEMLSLVADLKSERDDLMRDVEGWKQRVDDLEKSKCIIERRIESERREAWLKGEKLGLLEVENRTYIRQLEQKEAENRALHGKTSDLASQLERKALELTTTKRELEEARQKLMKRTIFENELVAAQSALLNEKKRCQELQSQLEAADLLHTPTPATFKPANVKPRSNALGFRSTDSWGSTTDVESIDGRRSIGFSFGLKAVQEEPEDDREMEDELAHYKDDDDLMDRIEIASVSSSFESDDDDDDLPRSTSLRPPALVPTTLFRPMVSGSAISISPSLTPSPCQTPSPLHCVEEHQQTHNKNGSLSRAWTFPRGTQRNSSPYREPEVVDRFFRCLDELDQSPPPLSADGKFSDKSAFSRALQQMTDDDDDILPPFILSSQFVDKKKKDLDVLFEEEEEQEHQLTFDKPKTFTFPSLIDGEHHRKLMHEDKVASVFKAECVSPPTNPGVHPVTSVPSGFPPSRTNTFITPTKSSNNVRPPSRIQPPSPPRFSSAPSQRKFPASSPFQTKIASIPTPSATPRPLLAAAKVTVVQGKVGRRSNININAVDMNDVAPSNRSNLFPPDIVNNGDTSQEEKVASTTSPSFSARLSLQTFTNFMPSLSWSPRGSGGDEGNTKDRIAHMGNDDKKTRNYVSKESQLEKLRARMTIEQLSHDAGTKSDAFADNCHRCVGDLTML